MIPAGSQSEKVMTWWARYDSTIEVSGIWKRLASSGSSEGLLAGDLWLILDCYFYARQFFIRAVRQN